MVSEVVEGTWWADMAGLMLQAGKCLGGTLAFAPSSSSSSSFLCGSSPFGVVVVKKRVSSSSDGQRLRVSSSLQSMVSDMSRKGRGKNKSLPYCDGCQFANSFAFWVVRL